MSMTILIVICILIILLVTPLLLSVSVINGTYSVVLRYLFIKKIFSNGLEEKKKEEPKKKKRRLKLSKVEIKEIIFVLLSKAFNRTKKLFKKTYFKEFELNVSISGKDASDTGIKYGNYSALIYTLLKQLSSILNLEIKKVDIEPDFIKENEDIEYSVKFKIKVKLISLLIFAIVIGLMILKFLRNNKSKT